MDCGAACLRAIHAHFGYEIGYREARQLAKVSRYGTSLLDLREAAERLGYVAAGAEAATWESLQAVQLPAVAHIDKNHYVVVWRVSRRTVLISDPALGKIRLKKDEFLARYGGYLLLLRPTDAVKKPGADAAPEKKTRREREFSWWRLAPFARPHVRVLIYILLASVLLQLFGVVTPMLTQVIIDRVIGHGETKLLNVAFAALVCSTIFGALIGFSRNHLMLHASLSIERTLMETVYQRVLSMAHSFFSRFTTGDLVRRFAEVEEVKNFVTGNMVSILLDLLMVFTYGAVLVWMQPALSGVYLGILAASAVVGYLLARPVRGYTEAFMQKFSLVNTHVIDSFRGIDPVKAMALERPFGAWFTRLLLPALEHGRKAAGWTLASGVFIQLIDGINSGLVLWRGAYLVIGGAMTLGQLMAFLMLSRQLTGPFLRLLGAWGELQRTIVSLNRVGDLLEETPEADLQQARGAMLELEQPRGEIRFENLSFRYSSDPKDASRNVIDDLNLHITPGEVIGIVGRSGCGKSTLARLLLRFEEPSTGRITLDGIHLRDVDPRSLRRQIGLVTQDAVLYSGSISDNIVCGREEVTEDDMIRAARAAGAYDFISELPYGFETRIGDQGMKLSGGQAQRIVIARALCTNPQILIFDEATAALDPLVEREIHEGLREVIRGRTTIIIAHRLHTLRRADRIVVLDRGRLVEQGPHEELMKAAGLYRRMYTASPDWQAGSESQSA
jgi:ATP-binding cassette subfamily B protein